MRVQVIRAKNMPHNITAWIDDQPEHFVLYVDEDDVTEQGANAIEEALTTNIANWLRKPNCAPTPNLHLHTG